MPNGAGTQLRAARESHPGSPLGARHATRLQACPVEAGFEPRPGMHQASGMVAAQLGIPVADALVLIRARVYAAGELVKVIANDVIARRLRLADA